MRKTRSSGNIKQRTEEKKKPEGVEKYQFINKNYSKYLNCPICKLLMKGPMRIDPCGHTFCSSCTSNRGKCPICSDKIGAVQKDLVGQGLINEMTVRCLNEGCPYKGTYEEYKNYHQAKCTLGKGFDEWLKQMKGTLDFHREEVKRRISSDQNHNQEAQNTVKSNMEFRRPQSPQKMYSFEEQLLQKTLKAEL